MAKKSTTYSKEGIKGLPNNKPVVYKIETMAGNPNYLGSAKRGRVRERIEEHLGQIPGKKVHIETFSSIREAQKKESNDIKRLQPKYNKKGKWSRLTYFIIYL